MRKFYLFVIAALVGSMTFTSCSKDNAQAGDDTPSTVKAKVGIIIYGNAGGDMDGLIESYFFDKVDPCSPTPQMCV